MASHSTPVECRAKATRSRLETSVRQWGMAMPAPHAGRSEVLAAPENAEQRGRGAVIGVKQLRHLLQDVVLRRSGEVESHCIVADEVTEAHGPPR